MVRLETDAVVCGLRTHGEHGAVVKLLTPSNGVQAAYVRGARGRRMRPVLMPGNRVQASLRARSESQLLQAEVELLHSIAPLMSEPLPAAAIEWSTALTATTLPEGQTYSRLHAALDGLLSAIEAAQSASAWGAALVRYELLLLAELGFGLDLDSCAVTGRSDDLVAVSPASGRAVSAAPASEYVGRLLNLPAFIRTGGSGSWRDICDGLRLSGHFLARDVLTDRSAPLLDARARLIDRIVGAGGPD
jgi:DNA repair protein RecO (recombination protein O)